MAKSENTLPLSIGPAFFIIALIAKILTAPTLPQNPTQQELNIHAFIEVASTMSVFAGIFFTLIGILIVSLDKLDEQPIDTQN